MDPQINLTKFQESGVIISDDKSLNDLKVSVTIDTKMVHLKEQSKKGRFDRMIPLRQVASCEVHRKSNNTMKWVLRILGVIVTLAGLVHEPNPSWGAAIIGIILFVISFFIHDDFYIEIAASNGVPIKCKFEAKNKDDNVNERFVTIVRQLMCEIQ